MARTVLALGGLRPARYGAKEVAKEESSRKTDEADANAMAGRHSRTDVVPAARVKDDQRLLNRARTLCRWGPSPAVRDRSLMDSR
jgi:hypothetical protein